MAGVFNRGAGDVASQYAPRQAFLLGSGTGIMSNTVFSYTDQPPGGTAPGGNNCTYCFPVQCASSPTFNLSALLQQSMAVEDEFLAETNGQSATDHVEDVEGNKIPQDPPCLTRPRLPGLDYQHWQRQLKADADFLEKGQVPRQKTLKTLVPLAVKYANYTDLDCFKLPATNGAYGAKISKESICEKAFTLDEVKAMGMTVFEWDGIKPVPFVDKEGRIFAVLAGRPTSPSYLTSCDAVYNLLSAEGKNAPFTLDQKSHRRGNYPALNVGVTHGMGTLRPTFLDTHPHSALVDRLLNDRDVQRIATYGSAAFALWSPKTYEYYRTRLKLLFTHPAHHHLRRIFPKSVFTSAAFNFGPDVWTRKHNDGKNYAAGWCSVTPMGHFDPTTGGHLILWELGMAVEFPAGSTILIPSATISHSNTALVDGGERASFTQYCSGGLFRWVDYNFQSEKSLKKNDPALYEEILRIRPERWRMGLNMWSKIEELVDLKMELANVEDEVQEAIFSEELVS